MEGVVNVIGGRCLVWRELNELMIELLPYAAGDTVLTWISVSTAGGICAGTIGCEGEGACVGPPDLVVISSIIR